MRIELVGELDVATAPELRSRVDEVTSADGDAWIDCTELTFADSSGLDTLTRLAKALHVGRIEKAAERRTLASQLPEVR